MARILRETAELLQIDGAIIGRYRSYEKTAELIGGMHESIEQIAQDPAKLTELPGIGDRMAEHILEILKTGDYSLRAKLLKKFPATLLEVIRLQSLGPKKVAFLWSTFKAATVADVERLAKEGKLRDLPGFGDSDRPTRNRISAYVEDVQAALAALDVHDFTLVGHSLGGAVAAGLAERLAQARLATGAEAALDCRAGDALRVLEVRGPPQAHRREAWVVSGEGEQLVFG